MPRALQWRVGRWEADQSLYNYDNFAVFRLTFIIVRYWLTYFRISRLSQITVHM